MRYHKAGSGFRQVTLHTVSVDYAVAIHMVNTEITK